MSDFKWIGKTRIREILQGRFDDWTFAIASEALATDYGRNSSPVRKLQEIQIAWSSKENSLDMTKVKLGLLLEDLR